MFKKLEEYPFSPEERKWDNLPEDGLPWFLQVRVYSLFPAPLIDTWYTTRNTFANQWSHRVLINRYEIAIRSTLYTDTRQYHHLKTRTRNTICESLVLSSSGLNLLPSTTAQSRFWMRSCQGLDHHLISAHVFAKVIAQELTSELETTQQYSEFAYRSMSALCTKRWRW